MPEQKLRMIPPGYDDTRFFPVGTSTRQALRRRLGFEGKVVLALGRIARNKGYDLLIRFGINGLFADTFDVTDLGITILKPLQYPPLAERLSRRGAQTARRLFTWTGVAQRLISETEQNAHSRLAGLDQGVSRVSCPEA